MVRLYSRKIFSQWRLKTEHYFQEVEQVEISETIFRKNSLSDIDATIISQSEYFVDNLVGKIRYKQCTTGGQPCPLGGCTGTAHMKPMWGRGASNSTFIFHHD
jgi:hypothetical protein